MYTYSIVTFSWPKSKFQLFFITDIELLGALALLYNYLKQLPV